MSASAVSTPRSCSVQINPMKAAIAASYSSEFMSASGQGGGNALPSYRQAGALLFL